MELIAAILLAGPLGYLSRTRKRGLALYLIAWAVIFPIQTAVAHANQPDDINVVYFVLNAAIVGLGIAFNAAGSRLRARRSLQAGPGDRRNAAATASTPPPAATSRSRSRAATAEKPSATPNGGHMMRLINSRALAVALLGVAILVPATIAAPDPEDPNGHGGRPTVEKQATTVTFHDSFIQDICGIATQTTLTQRTTTKTYPDGYTTVHVNGEWVPDDPRIASERDAFTDVIQPDGTVTTKGLAIRLYRNGEGTVIRDAGWVRFLKDGLIVRGPHPFLDTDPADVFC